MPKYGHKGNTPIYEYMYFVSDKVHNLSYLQTKINQNYKKLDPQNI